MSDLSMDLEGMELLTIQYLLDGENSAYGYKFDLFGLDKADFSGSREEQMLATKLVKQAEEAGDLRKVKFYVTHEDSPERTRAIQLNFFEDGHVSSTSEVRPREFNEIVNAISVTKSYSPYLTSLTDLIKEYILEIELDGERMKHQNRVDSAFEKLLATELGISKTDIVEGYMHKMVVANIGIYLYDIALSQDDLNYDGDSIPTQWDDYVKEFFTLYTQYNLLDAGEDEFRFVASNLKETLDEWSDKDDGPETLYGAMGLLQTFIDKYDLQD